MAATHQSYDEKAPVDHLSDARLSSDEEKLGKPTDIHHERNALLADLPDPDVGLSEEEKKKIDRKLMWKVDVSIRAPSRAQQHLQSEVMLTSLHFSSGSFPGSRCCISYLSSTAPTLEMLGLPAWRTTLGWKAPTTICR